MEYDGDLISELGVKRYLVGYKAQPFANINPLQSRAGIQKSWDKCNFGCHTPAYRVLRKQLTRQAFFSDLAKVSPVAAGVAAGVEHQTLHQANLVGSGAVRTAEGLHLAGGEAFGSVGAENAALFNLVRISSRQLLNAELSTFNNPLCQLVLAIVYEYIKLIPDWVVAQVIDSNALVTPDRVDKQFLHQAANHGFIEPAMLEHIDAAASALQNSAIKAISKNQSAKITQTILCIVAAKITRKILLSPGVSFGIKKRLAAFRKASKGTSKGLAATLILLLKANGHLAIAARSSRRLQRDCPKFWRVLRHQFGGLDMLLFLVDGAVQEYLDRISLLERSPQTYLNLMAALIKAGKTKEIFLPA